MDTKIRCRGIQDYNIDYSADIGDIDSDRDISMYYDNESNETYLCLKAWDEDVNRTEKFKYRSVRIDAALDVYEAKAIISLLQVYVQKMENK